MKPNAPVNDSLIALENHLSDINLQPDDTNIFVETLTLITAGNQAEKLILKIVSASLLCNV